MRWTEVASWFTNHEVGEKSGPAFACATFNGLRSKKTISARGLIGLDIETNKLTGEVPPQPQEVVERLKAREWAASVYTTHRHSDDAPRFRVVMPLGTPIVLPTEEPERAREIADDKCRIVGVADALGLADVLDGTKCGAASLFFTARHPPDATFFSEVVAGVSIDSATLGEAVFGVDPKSETWKLRTVSREERD
jgi:hypothetical protein